MKARSPAAVGLQRATQLTVVAALTFLAACSGVLRAKFPTEDEVRGKLRRGMTADEVLATFGEPPGHQWVDVQLGGKVRYIAPSAARTKKEAGYTGFTIYFDRGKVWDWEVIVMNPSYEHRLFASTTSKAILAAITLLGAGGVGYLAFRRWRSREGQRKELIDAYCAHAVSTAELPPDFQFITRETTLQNVTDKAGPPSRAITLPVEADVAQATTPIPAFEYELPDHGAVIVMAEHPFRPESRIRAIVYRRPRREIDI